VVDIRRLADGAYQGTDAHGQPIRLAGDALVSMNLWAFTPAVFALLRRGFAEFLRGAGAGQGEFLISHAIRDAVRPREARGWLLGVSLVATTFSTDTPNLITDLVRTGGVSQNWVWWAFAVTGMCTVFFYAKLWRRSAALTDIAFYEVRYSGKPAAFLRGFRAIYLGVFFNVMIMASVNLSATKIAGVMLDWDRHTSVLIGGGVTVLYAASSGLSGVVLTDFVQFLIA